MTNNTLPPENCICGSFYTVRGKHKPDCSLYDNTLDKEIDEIHSQLVADIEDAQLIVKKRGQPVGEYKNHPEIVEAYDTAKSKLKSLITTREKQMLEFVIGEDREVKGNYDYQINEEKSKARQRAKEWRERK